MAYNFYEMDQKWRDEQEAEKRRQAEEQEAKLKEAEAARASGGGSGSSNNNGSNSDGAASPGSAPPAAAKPSQAEELADNAIGDLSREETIREQRRGTEPELETSGLEAGALTKVPEYQRRAIAMMGNALTMKNVQKVVTIGNREKIRKGLSKDPVRQKATGAQVSTVAIPTALLRYVQQEIGAVQSRLNQNDAMTGFLYWYFGQPDDVLFQDETSAGRVAEVVENLDANASPARMGQLNYNISASLLDKLDVMSERLDGMAAMIGMIKGDGTELKVRSDKSYLAMCYLLLNYLGFTPLTAPGMRPSDLDLLVGGMAWDMMASVDDAYDYFRTTDGREKYKAKHGMRPATPYSPPVQSQQPSYSGAMPSYADTSGPADDDEDGDEYEGYEDIPDTPISPDDMDDFMDDFDEDPPAPPQEDDEDFDDGPAPTDMAALLRESSKRKVENARAKAAGAKFLKMQARRAASNGSGDNGD